MQHSQWESFPSVPRYGFVEEPTYTKWFPTLVRIVLKEASWRGGSSDHGPMFLVGLALFGVPPHFPSEAVPGPLAFAQQR